MKVRVTFTIDVDADRWRSYYDMDDFSAADVRADINETAQNLLLEDLADTGSVAV